MCADIPRNARADFPYIIRRMMPADIPAVVNIDRTVFSDPWSESVYVEELYYNLHARYFVLQLADHIICRHESVARNDRLVGFIGMRLESNHAHISTLGVHPHWQGQGLGDLLLNIAIQQAIAEEFSAATLEVRESNTVAQHLYKTYDFIVVTRLRRYYEDGEAALVMRASPLDARYYRRLVARHAAILKRIAALCRCR